MLKRIICPAVLTAIAPIVCSGGCTSETALPTYPTVVEVVFPDGRPIPGAQVTFRSAKDKKVTAYAKADANGICRMVTRVQGEEKGEGAVFGPHQVVVASPMGEGDLDAVQVAVVPPKYANYSSSGLEFTVTEDEAANRFKIVVGKD